MALSSENLNSEAYVGAGLDSYALQLNPTASAGFKVYQNEPNPFADATMIKYQLPYSAEVTLSFFDAQGKLLKAIEATGSKGLNEIQVASGDFEPGLIYYLLESGEFSQIKKMIILD